MKITLTSFTAAACITLSGCAKIYTPPTNMTNYATIELFNPYKKNSDRVNLVGLSIYEDSKRCLNQQSMGIVDIDEKKIHKIEADKEQTLRISTLSGISNTNLTVCSIQTTFLPKHGETYKISAISSVYSCAPIILKSTANGDVPENLRIREHTSSGSYILNTTPRCRDALND